MMYQKKLNKTVTELDGKYVIDCFGFSTYGGYPNTDLFQKRGSNKFESFRFYINKKYQPKRNRYKYRDYEFCF